MRNSPKVTPVIQEMHKNQMDTTTKKKSQKIYEFISLTDIPVANPRRSGKSSVEKLMDFLWHCSEAELFK